MKTTAAAAASACSSTAIAGDEADTSQQDEKPPTVPIEVLDTVFEVRFIYTTAAVVSAGGTHTDESYCLEEDANPTALKKTGTRRHCKKDARFD